MVLRLGKNGPAPLTPPPRRRTIVRPRERSCRRSVAAPRSGVALAVGLAAAAAAVAGAVALANGQARATSTPLAATTIVAGCAFVLGGIVAWLGRRANRTGLLMIAIGFLLLA